MTLDEFQDKLRSLNWADFERFVVDILRSTGRYGQIEQSARIVGGAGHMREFDIVAIEANSLTPIAQKWYFEVKKRNLTSVDVIDSLIGKHQDLQHAVGPARLVLVTCGSLTQAAKQHSRTYGIEVWDGATLASLATPEIIGRYFGEGVELTGQTEEGDQKSNLLLQALHQIAPGRDAWSAYQRLSAEIFEYLFCPPLEPPRYNIPDADSRNIRDMIFENSMAADLWALIRTTYSADYIVIDAKNYSDPIEKEPILDIAHYLKPYGCGLFGILLTRQGASEAAEHAVREQWIGAQKMIVILSDSDIEEMLTIKASGGKPEEIIRKKIADFRMSL